ncbi:unnamed protein product [Microthlaspi erraticum]|uniref:Arabidopsis retrotransposon Orf1 C-terminal domain-containing protein n=1 Tax=Microthlaspi erraticum TaxID=1685480 RepID=A0A6D2KR57_9BRAS|nr:unnamed protein product [Microthlaspi erraticum]
MKKKKIPFMQPPRKQIKLGSSSSNARAEIPTSPHSIDANQEHVESPRREDDWALVSFVGEQIQDPRVQEAMEKLGLSKLFKIECSEYSMLTKEFLSTVALAFPNHNGDQPAGDGLLLFKIGDANGRISISALCQLFGLPNETAHDFKENSKRKQAAFADWTHFANEPFLPSRSKVSRITHPAIRYVHRLISTTFQCKQEANKVTTDEFYILTTPFIKHEYKANLGLLLAKTLINVRNLAKDLEGNKKLCVRFGRLITAIVQHRSYNQKSEDWSRRLYRESAPKPRRPAGRGTNVSRSAKITSVRLSLGQSQDRSAEYTSRPGKHVPRSATPQPLPPCRASREKASRPRNLSRVPRPMAPSEPGSYVPRPAEKASANPFPSDHSGRPRTRPATTVPIVLRAAMTRSSGRSSRPTVRTPRSTRSPF